MWYYRQTYRYELYHHGILGQKWGKRNGPPYPLDASGHSASERKAGWKKGADSRQGQGCWKLVEQEQRNGRVLCTDGVCCH